MRKIFVITLMLLVVQGLMGQNIKRRGFVGIKGANISDSISNLNNGIKGIIVNDVVEKSSAFLAGVQKGDIMISFNGIAVENIVALRDLAGKVREGDVVNFIVRRDGKELSFAASAPTLPFESSDEMDIIYDEVKYRDGYIRLIINKPKGEGKFKSIMFIPGYMCYSLDNIGKHPYGQIVEGLCRKGYAVLRVEKLGMGDCMNTPNCFDVDYQTEVDGFSAGYEKFKTYDFVDTDNLFIFGHSLGGYEAPMIASKYGAKGVIVCGTGYKTWYEYILEMFRFQNIIAGADFIENENLIKKMIPLLYDFLVAKKTPKELSQNIEYTEIMKDYLEFDGTDKIWSRNYTYWQQLQDLNMPEIWKSVNSNVLIIRGEGDFEAFSVSDHKSIEEAVNFYHPGKAKFVSVPDMDHGFAKAKDPADSYLKKQIPGYYYNNFNNEIFNVISNWINGLN